MVGWKPGSLDSRSVVFLFQAVLLAGYCYAHLLVRFLPLRFQVGLHLESLTNISLLPIYPSDSCRLLVAHGDPTWSVIKVLAQSVGVQFFLLSTTAPLTQVWWYRVSYESPYWLYAISNAGSLLALITYPFFVEPSLGMTWQAFVWGAGFACVAILVSFCSLMSFSGPEKKEAEVCGSGSGRVDASLSLNAISWKKCTVWILLSSCSFYFLTVGNQSFLAKYCCCTVSLGHASHCLSSLIYSNF